jgi:hypothetical protein
MYVMEIEEEFQVRDRRAYLTEDAPQAAKKAEPMAEQPAASSPPSVDAQAPAPDNEPASPDDPPSHGEPTDGLPQVNFISFISSLAMAVMHHLGQGEERGALSLSNAQQTIDLLALLQEKTKGNLTAEEEQAMTGILYALRMNFVAIERESRRP